MNSHKLEYTLRMMAIATPNYVTASWQSLVWTLNAGWLFCSSAPCTKYRMTEGGVYGATPVGGLPWGIECNRISANATSFTNGGCVGFLVALDAVMSVLLEPPGR